MCVFVFSIIMIRPVSSTVWCYRLAFVLVSVATSVARGVRAECATSTPDGYGNTLVLPTAVTVVPVGTTTLLYAVATDSASWIPFIVSGRSPGFIGVYTDDTFDVLVGYQSFLTGVSGCTGVRSTNAQAFETTPIAVVCRNSKYDCNIRFATSVSSSTSCCTGSLCNTIDSHGSSGTYNDGPFCCLASAISSFDSYNGYLTCTCAAAQSCFQSATPVGKPSYISAI